MFPLIVFNSNILFSLHRSIKNGNAIIKFDITKTNKTEVEQAITNTGYEVTNKTGY